MIIKKNNSNKKKWFKDKIKFLYQRKIFLITIFIGLFIAYTLAILFYGMVLQKQQVSANLNHIIYNATKSKLNIIPNYFKGLFSSSDKIIIDIKFKDLEKLNYARSNALKRGYITEKDKSIEAKADLRFNDQKYKVQLSPTGQNLDMIGDPNKYAFKVSVKKGEKINGMKEFKLIPPKARNHITEWIAHRMAIQEGVIALRYGFLNVSINGESKGVYAFEEHFNKELIENNHLREGLLFSFTYNNNIKIFNKKEILKDSLSVNQFNLLRAKWSAFINNDLSIEKIFDLEKYAKFFAIAELLNGNHAVLQQNLKMYFNPVTNLIEPIPREYNSLRYQDGFENKPLIIQDMNWNETQFSGKNYLNRLFDNKNFIMLYLNNLIRISKKSYLDTFFEDNIDAINNQLNIIYKEEPYYSFPYEYMYLRQEYILNQISDFDITTYYNTDNKDSLHIIVHNKSPFPINLLDLSSNKDVFFNFNDYLLFGSESKDFFIDANRESDIIDFELRFSTFNDFKNNNKLILIPRSFTENKVFPNHLMIQPPNIEQPYLTVIDNEIILNVSKLTLNKKLIIPKGYTFKVRSGTKIDLINNASILSYSPINFIGNSDNPILVQSSDTTGQGILIINAQDLSVIDNVIFNNLTNPKDYGWEIPGAITAYSTNIEIRNTIFENNHSEDFLNTIKSKFKIIESNFKKSKADAFDSDFSIGEIINCTFVDIGNDAIDFSGSDVEINNVLIKNIEDKAISGGEKSFLNGKNMYIDNAEIGITSKDLSILTFENITIDNSKVAFCAFKKKPEYGPGFIEVKEIVFNNVEVPHLIEEKSELIINGITKDFTPGKIEDMLYGMKYGKSSK